MSQKYTIEDLRDGRVVLENNGTIEELNKVLRLAFYNCGVATGSCNYYYKSSIVNDGWSARDEFELIPSIPIQSVKYFLTNNNMELKVTKEKVLEAASKCPAAKETLKAIFPEAFEDEKYIDLFCSTFGDMKIKEGKTPKFIENGNIAVRVDGNYAHKAFYLSSDHNWEIIKDNHGISVLVPTKK